jgi:membrane protein
MARSTQAGRQTWWATALTATLLAAGFRRRRDRHPEKTSTEKNIDRGWREVMRILYGHVSEHRLTAIAAGVTYFALLAMFPYIGAIVAVYGLFGDTAALGSHLDQLASFLPGGAIEIVGDQLKRAAEGGKTTLGFAFLASVAISLWSANAGVKALFDALNIVYDAKETRASSPSTRSHWPLPRGRSSSFSLRFPSSSSCRTLSALSAERHGMDRCHRAVAPPAAGIVLALAVIYRFGPCRENAQWHWITVGSAVTSLVWIIFSMAFSYYAANFGSYNKTYGSLGAMIGFMTWMWLSVLVVLPGAEIDAVLERADRGTAK